MFNIVLTAPIHEAGLEIFARHPEFSVRMIENATLEEQKEAYRNAHGILFRNGKVPLELLQLATNLKAVSKHGVGVDSIDVSYLNDKKIPILITPGANSVSVAEHAMALMLGIAKDMLQMHKACVEDNWHRRDIGTPIELCNKTLLILGFGRTGQLLAKMASGFSMRIIAYSRSLEESPIPGVLMTKDFYNFLPEADFLSLHLPLNQQTRHIIGEKEFKNLKKGAILINIARGDLYAEQDLAAALANGQLKGAGIDAYTNEPPVPHPAFFASDRSLFTPHSAAMTVESSMNMATRAAQNLVDAMYGKFSDETLFNAREILG